MTCTCITGMQVWDWTDPNCPVHGGYPAFPELPVIPTATNKKPWYLGWDGSKSGVENMEIVPEPKPEGGVPWDQPGANPLADVQKAADSFKSLGKASWVTVADMQKWLETLTAKLPPETYLAWDGSKSVDTALTSENTGNPATAPCRVFWNSHACAKPRIHVLPGHPAGPEHQCGWGEDVPTCSKVGEDGQLWGWDEYAVEWVLVSATVELTGEDAP